jgi:hypothetical protein
MWCGVADADDWYEGILPARFECFQHCRQDPLIPVIGICNATPHERASVRANAPLVWPSNECFQHNMSAKPLTPTFLMQCEPTWDVCVDGSHTLIPVIGICNATPHERASVRANAPLVWPSKASIWPVLNDMGYTNAHGTKEYLRRHAQEGAAFAWHGGDISCACSASATPHHMKERQYGRMHR